MIKKLFLNKYFTVFRSKGKVIISDENNIEPKETDEFAKSVAGQVNRIFLANLAADYPHLFEAQV